MAAAKQHMGSAQAENERVKALHDYTTVIAPISGVVVWRYADTGALIQGGTNSNSQDLPIVRLSQSSLLRLRIPVPEEDMRYVRGGRPTAGTGGCHRPLVHWKNCALHPRREL